MFVQAKRSAFLLSTISMVIVLLSACAQAPTTPGAASPAPKPAATAAAPASPAGTAAPAAASPAAGAAPSLVVARDVTLQTLDPHREFSNDSVVMDVMLYDPLLRIDAKDLTKIEANLAEKWQISDDGKTYTFSLRSGAKFASGNPVTADDVKFTLDRLKNVQAPPSFLMDGVKEVAAVDPATVRITLDAPDAAFLSKLAAGYTGILDSKVAKEHGAISDANAKDADKAQEWFNGHSAGGGPFVLESWTRNQEVRFRANPNYWRGAPKIGGIVMRDIPDIATQRQLLERGDIDIAMNIDPDTAKQLKSTPNVVVNQEGLSLNTLTLALTSNPERSKELANQKVRQAISYAIDYDGIVNGVLGGSAVQLSSVVPQGFLASTAVPPLKRDVARAKQLLAEAGYPNGFTVTATYPNNADFGASPDVLMQKLQSDLKEIGITLQLQPQEYSVWSTAYRAGQLSMVLAPWAPDYMDTDALIDPFATPTGVVAKRIFYKNDDNVRLRQQALQTTDQAKRAEIYKTVQQNLQSDAAFLGLVQWRVTLAYRNNVSGFAVYPPSLVDFYAVSKK